MGNIAKEATEMGLDAPKVTIEQIEKVISEENYIFQGLYTICVLTIKNGFIVSGATGCVSEDNYDRDLGKKYARERAIEKMWTLEGYLLAQKLYEEKLTNEA